MVCRSMGEKMKISKSRRELTCEEGAEYSTFEKHGSEGELRSVLLPLLAEGKIKAYWSDDHNEVVWQRNNDE